MIALLVPTRGRPDKFRNMVLSVVGTTTEVVNIYALLQSEEDVKSYAIDNIQIPIDSNKNVRVNSFHLFDIDAPTVHLWNKLSALAHDDTAVNNKIFMLASDDIIFDTKGWDAELIKQYNALENKIHVFSLQDYRVYDDGADLSTPHPLVTREYIDAMGYFIPPLFMHWHVDMWTVDIARCNSVFTHLKQFICVHDKVQVIEDIDETHERLRKRGWRERDKYVNDKCQHILEAEKARLKSCLA